MVKVAGSASRTLFLSLNRYLGPLRQTATNGSDVNDEEHVLPVLAAGVHVPNSRADDALPIYLRRSVVDWVFKHDVVDSLVREFVHDDTSTGVTDKITSSLSHLRYLSLSV